MRAKLFRQIHTNMEGITAKKLASAFGISTRTASKYLNEDIEENSKGFRVEGEAQKQSFNTLI